MNIPGQSYVRGLHARGDNARGLFQERRMLDLPIMAVQSIPVSAQWVDEHQVGEGHRVFAPNKDLRSE